MFYFRTRTYNNQNGIGFSEVSSYLSIYKSLNRAEIFWAHFGKILKWVFVAGKLKNITCIHFSASLKSVSTLHWGRSNLKRGRLSGLLVTCQGWAWRLEEIISASGMPIFSGQAKAWASQKRFLCSPLSALWQKATLGAIPLRTCLSYLIKGSVKLITYRHLWKSWCLRFTGSQALARSIHCSRAAID